MKKNRLLIVLFCTCIVFILTITFFLTFGHKNGESTIKQAEKVNEEQKETVLVEETPQPLVEEEPTEEPTEKPTPKPTVKPTKKPTPKPKNDGKLIVIDAGHQKHQNSGQEPIGPGASQTKPKVSSGTAGVKTGVPEYQLTLQVSLKLQKALEEAGYRVIMVRTSNDVNISNSERAAVANEAGADAFIRIHADGSENTSAQGAMMVCPTAKNPYCANIYNQSRKLSDCIIKNFVQATGCKSRGTWETDTMSGINWCKVPVTILEMGFMSNPEEDTKMEDVAYQNRMIQGIVNGFNAYFA